MHINAAISGDRNVIKKEAKKILKYIRPYNRNTKHVGYKNKCQASNNRGNKNHLKINQKIPEQHIRKHKTKELWKTAILNTAYILWKVLM
jgi:hypothetical protein